MAASAGICFLLLLLPCSQADVENLTLSCIGGKMGPRCNLENAAYVKDSENFLVDGSVSTCTKSATEWQVILDQTISSTWIRIIAATNFSAVSVKPLCLGAIVKREGSVQDIVCRHAVITTVFLLATAEPTQLCEFQVYAPTNVAVGKKTLPDYSARGVYIATITGQLVDGLPYSCIRSYLMPSWLTVDLGGQYVVYTVFILIYDLSAPEKVVVSGDERMIGEYTLPRKIAGHAVVFPYPQTMRRLQVNFTENSALTLCDLRIFAVRDCYGTRFGPACEQACNPSCWRNICHSPSGICIPGCKAGFKGAVCDSDHADDGNKRQGAKNVLNGNSGSWKTALIVVFLFIAVSIACGLFFVRYKGNNKEDSFFSHCIFAMMKLLNKQGSESGAEMGEAQGEGEAAVPVGAGARPGRGRRRQVDSSILVERLDEAIREKRSAGTFQEEFSSSPTGFVFTYKVAIAREHIGKNKFTSFYPYDFNRVVLQPLANDPRSHYINASYVKGHERERAFIAAQAPVKITLSDFLRMIWQEKSRIVVMLTNLVEDMKVKSERYWPETEREELITEEIIVAMTQLSERSNCTIRELILTKIESGETRTVKQFHFTTWPDHGVPSHVDMLDFFWKVRASWSPDSGPLLVHCSAGVGRTGTFIALWILSDQAASQPRVDPLATLTALRQQRRYMIQTLAQYEFLHEALALVVKLGNTFMDAEVFSNLYVGQLTDLCMGNLTLSRLKQVLPSLSVELKQGTVPTPDDSAPEEPITTLERDRIYPAWASLSDEFQQGLSPTAPKLEKSSDILEQARLFPSVLVADGFLKVRLTQRHRGTARIWKILLDMNSTVLVDLHRGQTPCVLRAESLERTEEGSVTVQWETASPIRLGLHMSLVHLCQDTAEASIHCYSLDMARADGPRTLVALASELAALQLGQRSLITVLHEPSEEESGQLVCAAVNLAETLRLDGQVELVNNLLRLQTSISPEMIDRCAHLAYLSLQGHDSFDVKL